MFYTRWKTVNVNNSKGLQLLSTSVCIVICSFIVWLFKLYRIQSQFFKMDKQVIMAKVRLCSNTFQTNLFRLVA